MNPASRNAKSLETSPMNTSSAPTGRRPAAPAFHVSAPLPGLPHVPAEVHPVKCPECSQRAATVHHDCPGPDDELTATLICHGCGSAFDLLASRHGYLVGLEIGVIVEAARRGDPRVTSGQPTTTPALPRPGQPR